MQHTSKAMQSRGAKIPFLRSWGSEKILAQYRLRGKGGIAELVCVHSNALGSLIGGDLAAVSWHIWEAMEIQSCL